MGKRKNASAYDEFYTRNGMKWTCKLCSKYSITVDIAKNGTNSLKLHLQNKHSKEYNEFKERSKPSVPPPPVKVRKEEKSGQVMRQTTMDEPAIRETSDPKSRKIDQAIMKLLAAAALPIKKNKEAIKRVIDEEDMDEFSRSDWETMKNVRDSLSVFCEATTMIQGRDASISLVLPYNAALQANVQINITKSIGHKELNEALLSNLKKRFDVFKLDQTYVTATLLNPSYKQNDPLNKAMKDYYIEQLLDEICSAEKDTQPLMTLPPQQQAEVVSVTTCFLDVLKENDEAVHESEESEELKTKKQIIRGQLESYFKEPTIPFKASAANYWKLNGGRFGHIAALYRKYGTAPATSAEVERLFSLAGNIVTDLRKRLTDERVEKLLFLNANLPLLDD